MSLLSTLGRTNLWASTSKAPHIYGWNSRCASLSFPPRLNQYRTFASSRFARATHYEELGIPKNATKQQIKISYYKLSKLYHPDLAQGSRTESEKKYHAVRAAYEILGNDRKRREYDSSLSSPTQQQFYRRAPSSSNGFGPHLDNDIWSSGAHRGATHAWERYHRNSSQPGSQRTNPRSDPNSFHRPPPPYGSNSHSSQSQSHAWQQQHSRRDSARSRRRQAEWDEEHANDHRVRNESALVRFLQVFGIFWVLSLFGGWSVNAS
ncbi:DnaJ-domain-containing protein [Clavulina sp. PMI_390]|nr:DnaJ-domain-containing protein [Clavulina sp. PMI_390]